MSKSKYIGLVALLAVGDITYLLYGKVLISENEKYQLTAQSTEANLSPATSEAILPPSLESPPEAESVTKSDQVPNFLFTMQTIRNNLINKVEIGNFGALLIIDEGSTASTSEAYLWYDNGQVTLTQVAINERTDIAKMESNGELKGEKYPSNWSSLPTQWPLNDEGAAKTLPIGAVLFLSTLSLPSSKVPSDHRGLFQCASGDYIVLANPISELAECQTLRIENDTILLQKSNTSDATVIAMSPTPEHPLPEDLHEDESTWRIITEDGKPRLPSPMTRIGPNFSTPYIIVLEDGYELHPTVTHCD